MTHTLTPKQLEWLTLNHKEYPIKCKMCDNHVKWRYLPGGGAFNIYCSSACAKLDKDVQRNKQQSTMLTRYGVKHNWNIGNLRDNQQSTMLTRYGSTTPKLVPQLIEKTKQTNLEKYGVENPLQHPEVKNKRKQTMLKRYGVEYTAQSPMLLDKMKQTNLQRYGVEYATQHPDILEKIKQTNLEKYGYTSFLLSPMGQQQSIQTSLKKYGVEYQQQSIEGKQQRKQSNLEKYGVNNHSQTHMINILPLIQDYDWLFEQYITQNKTAVQIANELNINNTTIGRYLRKFEIEIKYNVRYSYKQILWLTYIMEQEGIYIQHAGNMGEYQIPGTRYKADGYCAETNTIYEFYGDYWHGNPNIYLPDKINKLNYKTMNELYTNTIIRENQIISIGYNLVSIWESEFNDLNINQ